MKKLLIISSFLIIILAFSMVGYKIVSANEGVDEIKDSIAEQERKESYLTPYGYTLDNPNVVLDPYDVSPLTAIILFETDKEEMITVKVEGKDENSTYINKFNAETKHYIPIYGLYPNAVNKVYITCGKITKMIEIKTGPLPSNLKAIVIQNNTNKLAFVASDSYPYAVDNNNDIRWYLTKKYSGEMKRLANGNFLLGNDSFYVNGYRTGVVEIDLFGKIYKQYNLNHGYYENYIETDTSVFMLSKSLIEFDKLSGTILRTFTLNDNYDDISYDKDNNAIMLYNKDNALQIDLQTNMENEILSPIREEDVLYSVLPFYIDDKNYHFVKGVKFTNVEKTPTSKENIFLVNYKEPDDDYKSYKIKFNKTSDYFELIGNFKNNQNVYLILDKFLDKRVYDVDNGHLMIQKEGLSGKYSIYIKIDDKIYKTNRYLSF